MRMRSANIAPSHPASKRTLTRKEHLPCNLILSDSRIRRFSNRQMRARQSWMRLRVAWRMKAVPMSLCQAFPMLQDIRAQMMLRSDSSFICRRFKSFR